MQTVPRISRPRKTPDNQTEDQPLGSLESLHEKSFLLPWGLRNQATSTAGLIAARNRKWSGGRRVMVIVTSQRVSL